MVSKYRKLYEVSSKYKDGTLNLLVSDFRKNWDLLFETSEKELTKNIVGQYIIMTKFDSRSALGKKWFCLGYITSVELSLSEVYDNSLLAPTLTVEYEKSDIPYVKPLKRSVNIKVDDWNEVRLFNSEDDAKLFIALDASN